MTKYFKMVGFILLFLIVYYVAQITVTGIFSVFYFVGEIAGNHGAVDQNAFTEGIMKDLNVILILAILVSLPLYMFICWLRNQSLFKVCEFVGTGFKNIALSAIAGISTSIFFAGLLSRIPIDKLFPGYSEMIGSLIGEGNFILTVASAGILVPLIEEIIFRGLVFRELNKHLPVSAAVIIQALLFGIYHMNLLQAIYAFLIGLVLALVLIKTGSIWPSIILHAFLNNTSTVMGRVLNEDIFNNFSIVMAAVSLLVLAAALVFLWKGGHGERTIRTDSEGGTQ